MTPKTGSQKGFTLLELVTVTAVVAVLGAVAVHLYGYYTDRARAVDIIGKFDAIRSGSTSRRCARNLRWWTTVPLWPAPWATPTWSTPMQR
jgi:prepilin-type N-terminal cleavage/methylation domain-containing protein